MVRSSIRLRSTALSFLTLAALTSDAAVLTADITPDMAAGDMTTDPGVDKLAGGGCGCSTTGAAPWSRLGLGLAGLVARAVRRRRFAAPTSGRA